MIDQALVARLRLRTKLNPEVADLSDRTVGDSLRTVIDEHRKRLVRRLARAYGGSWIEHLDAKVLIVEEWAVRASTFVDRAESCLAKQALKRIDDLSKAPVPPNEASHGPDLH